MLLNPSVPTCALLPVRRLRALIFDWAGTTVDFGSLAPVRTLQQTFAEFGLEVSDTEARRDMGLAKRDHIAQILSSKGAKHDIAPIYARFVALQLACLAEYSSVIPGVPEAVEMARSRGLRIGSTTGYTRQMLDLLIASSAPQRWSPDCSLTPEDVGAGRPLPFMIYENAVRLHAFPMAAIAKIGDTVADIEEGLQAGVWTIGVIESGNMVGLSKAEWKSLPDEERAAKLDSGRARFEQAGAHYAINRLSELEGVLDDITTRLSAMELKARVTARL